MSVSGIHTLHCLINTHYFVFLLNHNGIKVSLKNGNPSGCGGESLMDQKIDKKRHEVT